MEEKIVLQPFDRILSGYEKLTEVAVSVADCSQLCQKYQSFGVQGYRLDNYQGTSYLNRYLSCSVERAPMLIYRNDYLIPLVFRSSPESKRLFDEPTRMAGFFLLLEWLLANKPKKALITNQSEQTRSYQVVDSAYVAFRLSEILDGAGFPISQFQTVEEFMAWNRQYRLINNGQIGRHSKIFDPENQENVVELRMILEIIHLKYPETTFFI
ncbi:hypothetical protein IV487_00720 [Enterococcus saccharolyticus]|uniref:Uncharacterized protein n=1 Tax=Candidatus Enterococcus willemsii TaxID=1857215 RepID=A0ABQ6YY37_9ENTE|nr:MULTISPECIES: hypothetical protein [Enterococcus]KAF1302855.1 hypothetical protein BAU17_11605 [Enterococcus sp. CU12B]MCD5000998.1 hypothetical protein [Enterococcus saccharolyticus]